MARRRRRTGPHGPSLTARARGHRLDAAAAAAVVHGLRGATHSGAPLAFLVLTPKRSRGRPQDTRDVAAP